MAHANYANFYKILFRHRTKFTTTGTFLKEHKINLTSWYFYDYVRNLTLRIHHELRRNECILIQKQYRG